MTVAGFLADVAELVRNPRAWWWRATHAACPSCGQQVHVGRWYEHRCPPARPSA